MARLIEVAPVPNPKLEPLELLDVVVDYVEQDIGERNLGEDGNAFEMALNAKTILKDFLEIFYFFLNLNNVTKITWKMAKNIRIQRFDQYMCRKRSITPLPIPSPLVGPRAAPKSHKYVLRFSNPVLKMVKSHVD